MSDPAPVPDNDDLTDRQVEDIRITRLLQLLHERSAAEREEASQLSRQVDQIVPNGSALAMEAARNPSVTRFNVRKWFRRKLSEWITPDVVESAVMMALIALFMIYREWSFKDVSLLGGAPPPPPAPPSTWWDSMPSREDFFNARRRYPSLSSSMPCAGGSRSSSSSVVDEVFAEHEAKAKAVAHQRA